MSFITSLNQDSDEWEARNHGSFELTIEQAEWLGNELLKWVKEAKEEVKKCSPTTNKEGNNG